jgi:hypothetical protein
VDERRIPHRVRGIRAGDNGTNPRPTISAEHGHMASKLSNSRGESPLLPSLVFVAVARPEGDRVSVGDGSTRDVKAQPRLHAGDRAVGVDGPALVGLAAAGPDDHLCAGPRALAGRAHALRRAADDSGGVDLSKCVARSGFAGRRRCGVRRRRHCSCPRGRSAGVFLLSPTQAAVTPAAGTGLRRAGDGQVSHPRPERRAIGGRLSAGAGGDSPSGSRGARPARRRPSARSRNRPGPGCRTCSRACAPEWPRSPSRWCAAAPRP